MSYISPERVAGAPSSVADDLYAVGVMGYEALLARRAFPQDNPVALARAIMDDLPPPLTTLRGDLDPMLSAAIERAMARDPRRRFGSAGQMRAALAGDANALFAGAATPSAPPCPATKVLTEPVPPSAYYVPAPPRRRWLSGRTRKVAIAGAVLAAFAVSAVALASDPFSSSPGPHPVSTSTTVPTPTTSVPPPPPPTPTVQQAEDPGENAPLGRGNNGDPGHGNGKKKGGKHG